jgi:hypothetical protein
MLAHAITRYRLGAAHDRLDASQLDIEGATRDEPRNRGRVTPTIVSGTLSAVNGWPMMLGEPPSRCQVRN